MHTQVKSLDDCQLTFYLYADARYVCEVNSHLSGNAGSFRSIMLSPMDATFSVAFGRKILIEEDGCSSSRRIWVAAVILTVYNETPLRIAMVHREKGLLRRTGSCVERS